MKRAVFLNNYIVVYLLKPRRLQSIAIKVCCLLSRDSRSFLDFGIELMRVHAFDKILSNIFLNTVCRDTVGLDSALS